MELTEAIKSILSGESLLFVGSGFSIGAQNSNMSNRDMKGANGLKQEIGVALGVNNPSVTSLGRLSNMYIKKKGSVELIDLLKKDFQVSEVSDDHKSICAHDWLRVYSTNYDDVVERSYAFAGKSSVSVTPSENYESYVGQKGLIIHLNGYINTITPDKLFNEFKLTEASYCTSEFNDSPWVQMFRNDLRVCKSVFFVGFSMEYDLDLARIIAMSSIKDKAFFVVATDADAVDIDALSDFGAVLPIALSGLVKEISKVKESYVPRIDVAFNPLCFKEISLSKSYQKVRSEDFNDLLLSGAVNPALVQASMQDPSVGYLVYRSTLDSILSKIEGGEKNFLVESALGNGKTVFLYQLAYALVERGKSVFWYKKYNAKIYSEILSLSKLYPDAIVILDDYHSAKEAIFSLRKTSNSLVIVTSERQALHDVIYEDIQSILGNYVTISVDKLQRNERIEVDHLFDMYSVWGDLTHLAMDARVAYIENMCNSQFSSLILSRVSSNNIILKFKEAYSKFRDNPEFRRVFIVALINEFFRLKVDVFDFASWAGADVINSPSFRNNVGVREFLDTKDDTIKLRSSIIAHYFLSEMDATDVLGVLEDVVRRLDKTVMINPEHRSTLTALMNFSQLSMCLEAKQKGEIEPILLFYDDIKDLASCKDNIHFWLQYAIAQLTKENYTIAKLYFDKCYALAKMTKGYQTYKIDNHYSRYLLENEIKNGFAETCMDSFTEAHKILINTNVGDEKRYYPYRMALLYWDFYERFYKSLDSEEQYDFLSMCNDMYQKCIAYIRNCDSAKGLDVAKKTESKLNAILTKNFYIGFNPNYIVKRVKRK